MTKQHTDSEEVANHLRRLKDEYRNEMRRHVTNRTEHNIGVYNGLECALAALEGRPPHYLSTGLGFNPDQLKVMEFNTAKMANENSVSDLHDAIKRAMDIETGMLDSLISAFIKETGASPVDIVLVEQSTPYGFKYFYAMKSEVHDGKFQL